ncbi:Serine protease/Carboxylesterase S33 [Pleurotus pulmonarius]
MMPSKAFIRLVSLGAIFLDNVLAQDTSQDGLIWDKLETSPELKWTDCYTQLQCARFQVPLNYSNPEGDAASIAVIRFPSPLANTADYKGPILINPGGPGGSGVELMVQNGAELSQVLGPNFDIVSFDPRGVGRSTPRASFFDTEAQRRFFDTSFDVINATSDGLARIWARAQITGALATQHNQKNIFEHFNTESTARDMLRIVEAHGRKNIQYWGFSYGTVLGATFASLFPDRIDRLVLDGVVDAENYFATLWSNNLLDTDKTLQSFFDGCFEGGPDLCPFYESSPQAISQKLDDLTHTIFLRPVPVQTKFSYGLVDYERLRITIFQTLYSPYEAFPRLAQGLADLMHGNGTVLYQILEQPVFDCACGAPAPLMSIPDGGRAIMCTDGAEVRDTVDELEPYVQGLLRDSQWGEVWASIRIGCSAWPKQEKRHFKGPFLGNTSHPILWIGNTADPVTPIAGARKMAKGFPGSVLLTQDSPGHCSIAAPSVCTIGFVRGYFMNGTLPDEGVVCPVIQPIFSGQPVDIGGVLGPQKRSPSASFSGGTEEKDEDLVQALAHLRQNFRVPTPF